MVGVIGAGNWGKNLVRNFHELDALGAIAEASPGLNASLKDQYPKVPVYSDYRPLLDSDIPAVAVATPAVTHYAIVREALLAGKDVFVEKPLTLSHRDALGLVDLARERNRILMVGHLLLYQPAIQYIRAYIHSGSLGTVYSFHQERLNLGKARSVENAVWSLGVHDIAALLHLIGDRPSGIQVNGQRVIQSAIEDDVYLHLDFKNNLQAHLHLSWLWPERRRQLAVIGSEGMLVYDEAAQKVTLHQKGIEKNLENRNDGERVLFRGDDQPLRLELQHFLYCLNHRRTPLSDGESGAEVVRILEETAAQLEDRCRTAPYMNQPS